MAEILSSNMAKEKEIKVKVSVDDIVESLWTKVDKPIFDKSLCHHLFGRYYRINVFKSNTYGSTMVGSYFASVNDNQVDMVHAD